QSLEPGKPLPIGVSKKCCWTCWQLYKLLEACDSGFDLPGSHGTIYAWSPPEFGIPIAVLRDLRHGLLKEAGRVAVANAAVDEELKEQKSRASSPASVSTDEEEVITVREIYKVRKRRS
ncbi:hypothetical protein PENSPDRAFT_579395, partial [Peniophora sp. CONT]